ncbi:hypothetical protein [Sphingopyxis lindanitolerans]|uniref:hypothetical protein n=1 Tax=Sphingopyxis lindanitolerans TaxID=2054227 RepID=UPI001304B25D|nr:hypothetical protein [Sphingopyxis lindanitolerans]
MGRDHSAIANARRARERAKQTDFTPGHIAAMRGAANIAKASPKLRVAKVEQVVERCNGGDGPHGARRIEKAFLAGILRDQDCPIGVQGTAEPQHSSISES